VVFRLLPQGSYRLSISGPDAQVHEQLVEVKAQDTVSVTVILR
jgi:hypothetical protein